MDDRSNGPEATSATRALIVIPGSVNHFYNTAGRRVAEALSTLGYQTRLADPSQLVSGSSWGELCLIINIAEVGHAARALGLDEVAWLKRLRARFAFIGSLGMESVHTEWFGQIAQLSRRTGIEIVLDLGLLDQEDQITPADRRNVTYRFVPDGLTDSERVGFESRRDQAGPRPIPWCFIGHLTSQRAAFVDELVHRIDPRGFAYMPGVEPYTEVGSPHLNHDQFLRVLEHSDYHVWCSHHDSFYMELERFRLSALTGCIPLKVMMGDSAIPEEIPLRSLVVPREDLPAVLRPEQVAEAWSVLRAFYGSRCLSESLGAALRSLGLRLPTASRPRESEPSVEVLPLRKSA